MHGFISPAPGKAADTHRVERLEEAYRELCDELEERKLSERDHRHRNAALARENDELLRNADEAWHVIKQVTNERDTLQTEKHDLLRAHQADEAAITKSREEIKKYKQALSSVTRVENQVADDEIRAMLDQLYYSIQTFAVRVSNFGMSL